MATFEEWRSIQPVERNAFEELVADVSKKLGLPVAEVQIGASTGFDSGLVFKRGCLYVSPAWIEALDYSEQAFFLAVRLRMGRSYSWWTVGTGIGFGIVLALLGSAYFVVAMNFSFWAFLFAIPVTVVGAALYSLAVLYPIKEWAYSHALRRALEVTGSLEVAERGIEKRDLWNLRGEHPAPQTTTLDPGKELRRLRRIANRMRPRLES